MHRQRVFGGAGADNRRHFRKHSTVWPCQLAPHSAQAITMGSSSLTVMWIDFHDSGHRTCNHSPGTAKAPQPQPPEASEVRLVRRLDRAKDKNRATPFHPSMKRSHHISGRRCSKECENAVLVCLKPGRTCMRKVPPRRTTLQACCR